MDADRKARIAGLLHGARVRSRSLHEVLYSLCMELDGHYRAGQYAEMADNDLDGMDNWLDDAEAELHRWEEDHGLDSD